jgi:hypothetical protein
MAWQLFIVTTRTLDTMADLQVVLTSLAKQTINLGPQHTWRRPLTEES